MIGQRVAKLRAARGESLREAALRTGVSHTTIARIEKGEVTCSFHSTLRKIAEGYGVRLEYLLTGREPQQDFHEALRRLPPEVRARLYFVSPLERIRITLEFLLGEYTEEFTLEQVALQAGLEPRRLHALVSGGGSSPELEQAVPRLAAALARLTGIDARWFHCGVADDELPANLNADTLSEYLTLVKKAAEAGIRPEMLALAIDLLSVRSGEAALAGSRA